MVHRAIQTDPKRSWSPLLHEERSCYYSSVCSQVRLCRDFSISVYCRWVEQDSHFCRWSSADLKLYKSCLLRLSQRANHGFVWPTAQIVLSCPAVCSVPAAIAVWRAFLLQLTARKPGGNSIEVFWFYFLAIEARQQRNIKVNYYMLWVSETSLCFLPRSCTALWFLQAPLLLGCW